MKEKNKFKCKNGQAAVSIAQIHHELRDGVWEAVNFAITLRVM